MEKQYVWEFTNQKKLTKKEFINYFERKIFKTIRKYSMLPKNRIITIKKENTINEKILYNILKTKSSIKYSNKPNFSSENLSAIAENTFKKILEGKFTQILPKSKNISYPLYFHSDKEITLYAKLKNIKGKAPQRNPKIQTLFQKFQAKNPDLEINVVKAMEQIK